MSMEDEYNVAARYRTVRKHLDSLGYKHALTLDALPLIEKLLADLIQTTESLKHFKSIAQENIEAHAELQSTIDPYKCDNVKLVQECNQLHLDLMKEKESHQKQIKDLKREIYKLERECNDLQLASSRNLHRIKELETESAKKSKRILELQGKCLKPTISNVGLASKKRPVFPLRRPVLEGEPLPKTSVKSNPLPSLTAVEPKVVDLLSMADHKMNCLSHEVTKLKGELSLQCDNVQTLKCQLTTKEKEILRLKKMLDGGRPYSAVSRDCACKKGEDNYAMYSHNVDGNELKVLQQEKLELEQQLKEALNKQHDAMTQALKLADRNEELEKELRDIDHIALAVEADCNSAVKENNRRVSKLQEKLEDVLARVHVLEGELTAERRTVQELRADLEACRLEKNKIQSSLDSALDEKKRMTDRINELTVIERNLNEEIERMARENEKQKQDLIELQYSNRLLKDQLKSMGTFLDGDEANLIGAKERGKNIDNNRWPGQNGYIDPQEMYKQREVLQNGNGAGYNNIVKQLDKKEAEINDLRQTMEQLRRERDFYKNECNKVQDNFNKSMEKDHVDMWSRIRELKRQLSEKENALDELQQEKNQLLREKMNLETRLQTPKTDHKTCWPCNVCKRGSACSCSPPVAGKTKGIIERLEHERNIARADVNRLIEERDALRERLKMATEAHTSEQRRLRENLTEVEARLKQIERERQELLLTQGARRATINGLEDQLQDLREELRRTKQELATQRTQYFQLRALQDQTDQALGDAQNQLTQSETELNKSLDRNRSMERQQQQLENQVKELQQEINNLKGNMAHLDHEKDQLLMVLDEKTEKIATLEREIMLKDQQMMGSEHQIRELQHKNELYVDQSADQERQMRSLQMEMESLQRQLQTSTYDRENAIQENRRVQDDLAAATCEIRNLQRELEASRAESFDLKRQLQTYVSEVRRAEELLNRKENERTEMLNHFRSLSLEATVLENNNHSLESEAAEARGALQSARDRMLDLERQLADKDSLIRGYETQITELSQNVASMETQLRQQSEQKHRAEADLTAVRDLCVKLDQQKDSLMQQLDDKDALKAQYDMQIAKLKAEQAVIQDQMSKDRATVERLELLLDQARQESISVQTNNQELQNEMSRLRSKMSELQNKLSSESTKLRQYQTQAAEYSKQISELRRQVTNERFDRARKEEENRRLSESIPDSAVHNPLPNSLIPNESSDAKSRYLQSESSRESDGQAERFGVKVVYPPAVTGSEHTNGEQNCRCSHVKYHQSRDVPCINIILRSDCKMHSNMYNYVQKDGDSLQTTQKNEDSVKTDVKALDNTAQLNSLKESDSAARNIENNNNNIESKGTQDNREHKTSEELIFNNIPPTRHSNGKLFSYDPVTASTPARTRLLFKINETSVEPTTMLIKDTLNTLHTSDRTETYVNVSNRFSGYPVTSYKNFPVMKLEENLNDSCYSRRFPKPESNLLYTFGKFNLNKETFVAAPEKRLSSFMKNMINLAQTDFKSTSTNTALNDCEVRTTENSLKIDCQPYRSSFYTSTLKTYDRNNNLMKGNDTENFMHTNQMCNNNNNENTSACKKRHCTPNDHTNTFHRRTTIESKKLVDLPIQEQGDFCTNTNCTWADCSILNKFRKAESSDKATNAKSINQSSSKSRKSPRPVECDNKCISTIDEALNTLQNVLESVKKIRYKDPAKHNVQESPYQHRELRCKNMECHYPSLNTKYEDTLLDVNNIKLSELLRPECMKLLQDIKRHTEILEEQLTMKMNHHSIKTKKKASGKSEPVSENYTLKQRRDVITQNPEKKNIYIQESCPNYNCGSVPRGTAMKTENTVRFLDVGAESSTFPETYDRSITDKDFTYEESYSNTPKDSGESNSREMRNIETQCDTCSSFLMSDTINVKPLATSSPKKLNLSSYTQTALPPLEAPQAEQVMSRERVSRFENENDSSNINGGKCSNCEEDEVVMLLLAKSVNGSKCLRSRNKKSQFLNFRPKCLANSCSMYHHKSTRCKLSRRRLQIPIVFKLKPTRSRSKNSCQCKQKLLPRHSIAIGNVTNLETTVCTQSSDLQITAATSVPSIPCNKRNYVGDHTDSATAAMDSCTVS